jgi:imidazolonepropionase-like amidohydrolase
MGPALPENSAEAEPTGTSSVIALVGVHVIPMDREIVLRDRTILVRDGMIVRMGPADQISVPVDAYRPDVRGLYVMPGLIDMHVHLSRDDLPAYLAAGITTVRNMWGWSEIERIRKDMAAGVLEGPRVFSAGPAVDGDPPVRQGAAVITDPSLVHSLVQRQKAAGWEYIKVYQNLSRRVFSALASEATAAGLPLIGHVPTDVPFEQANAAMASIEHMEGYDKALTGARKPGFRSWLEVSSRDAPVMAALARATVERETWNCPTLLVAARVLGKGLSPDERHRAAKARRAMVRALHDAGARLLAGTDGGVPLVPAGVLAEELVELGRAGLSPYEALRAATVNAASFLGADGLGTLAEGMKADLVVLEADPLMDLTVVQHPAAVMIAGEWRPR